MTINYCSSNLEGVLKGAERGIYDFAYIRVIFIIKASIARINFTFVSTFGVSYLCEELQCILNAFGCFNGPVVGGLSIS